LSENRSAVGAVRRPRNHEPPAGTAWRDPKALKLLAGTAWRDAKALKPPAGTAWLDAAARRQRGHSPTATQTREQTSIAYAALHTPKPKTTDAEELT
jgi:hypothetical protein